MFPTNFQGQRSCKKEAAQTSSKVHPHEVWKLLNCYYSNDNKFTNEIGLVLEALYYVLTHEGKI